MNYSIELINTPYNLKSEIYEKLTKKLNINLNENPISEENKFTFLRALKNHFENILKK